ncbi:g3047 [Coccomyxa elongata]
MSLNDLSEDIFDAIFLEIFPGNADGKIKDVLNVYEVSKQFKSAVENAQLFWENACYAAGFKVLVANASGDLAWDPEVPPQGTWWLYFCARMRDRYKIRRLLRIYIPFLDHWSRGSFQYGLDASDIAELLSEHRVKLPWQIQELYHWKNGQNSSYMGVQFAYGTRLLSLQEVLEGYAEAMKAEKPGPSDEIVVVEGAACFPLTTERAGKQYCFDNKGAIYLKHGWNSICVAEDLAGFLQLLLR